MAKLSLKELTCLVGERKVGRKTEIGEREKAVDV